MKRRFAGSGRNAALVSALTDQWLVNGNRRLAQEFAAQGTLVEYSRGRRLIRQDAKDTDLFLILAGEVTVLINGRPVASRGARLHVGEMALVDCAARRSADIVAKTAVTVLRVPEPVFTRLARTTPDLWRRLAMEACRRLRERSVRRRNEISEVFVASSREGLPFARAVVRALRSRSIHPRAWTDGVFGPSAVPVDSLIDAAESADFAVVVLTPDDRTKSRGVTSAAPRDNLVFEVGLCMGAMGRMRTFFVVPRDAALKLPTDLVGPTPLKYDPRNAKDLSASLKSISKTIRTEVLRQGPR